MIRVRKDLVAICSPIQIKKEVADIKPPLGEINKNIVFDVQPPKKPIRQLKAPLQRRVKEEIRWCTVTYGRRSRNHLDSPIACAHLSVFVKSLRGIITPKQVFNHFVCCGPINEVRLGPQFAIIEFANVASVDQALRLNNSFLNNAKIRVERHHLNRCSSKNVLRTIFVRNVNHLSSIHSNTLLSIFEKFGTISDVTVVCTLDILALVTFDDPNNALAAMNMLNGTTKAGISLSLCPYEEFCDRARTRVRVCNVQPGTTEVELAWHFVWAGPIESVTINHDCALINFATWEGYSRAFLLHETVLHGQLLFVEPYSGLKAVYQTMASVKEVPKTESSQFQQGRKSPRLL